MLSISFRVCFTMFDMYLRYCLYKLCGQLFLQQCIFLMHSVSYWEILHRRNSGFMHKYRLT